MNNKDDQIVEFYAKIAKEDLESFTKRLFKKVNYLEVENALLKEKMSHLEELLKNVPTVPKLEE